MIFNQNIKKIQGYRLDAKKYDCEIKHTSWDNRRLNLAAGNR